MKKAATSASVGRNAQAVRAAAARRSVRLAKSRAGRSAVVAALGAGLLLQGGQASAAPADMIVRPVAVTVAVADDPDEGASSNDAGSEGDSDGDSEGAAEGTAEGEGPVDSERADADADAERAGADAERAGADAERAGADADDPDGTAREGARSEEVGASEEDTGADDVERTGSEASQPSTPHDPTPTTAPARSSVPPAPAGSAAGGPDLPAVIREAAARRGAALDRAAVTAVTRDVVGPAPRAVSPVSPVSRTSDTVAQSPVTRFVLALMGVGPHTAHGAPAPVAPSAALVLAQWAFFRRGENPLFNRSPVAPGQTGAPTTGRVVATDPDGDELTYDLLDGPARGAVEVDEDGSYRYVPNAELARTGGTDTFTVLVRDNDPSAPGLGRYTDLVRTALARSHPVLAARLFGAHTAVATITVQVQGTATPAPPRVVVNPSTGAVTGRVGPDDGVPRTYTVTVAPRSGTLDFDEYGTYVYVPTEAARRAAALTPGPDVDTFTVVVTDPDGVATARTFALLAADPGSEYSGTLPIAEIVTGQRTPVGPNPSAPLLSADGRYSAVRVSEGLTLVDNRDGSTLAVPASGPVNGYEFSRDGSRLVVASGSDSSTTLTVVDTATETVVGQSTFGGMMGGPQLSPDGRYIFFAERGAPGTPGFPPFPETPAMPGRLVVIDTNDGSLRELATGEFYNGFQLSPDGSRAYAADPDGRTVVVVDTGSGTVVRSLEVGPDTYQVAFSPDGSRAYVIDGAGELVVIRVADDTATALGPVSDLAYVDERAFSPDGRYLVLLGNDQVTVVDVAGDRILAVVPADSPAEIVYSPDGRLAYVGGYGDDGPGTVTAIDLANGTGTSITVGDGYRDVAFSPDGTRAYVTTWDGTVTVIDTATATVVGTYAVPERSFVLRLSPDGTLAYVTSTNDSGPEDDETGDLTVIDLATGDTTVVSVGNRPGAALVSPDGRRVYVDGYYGGTVSVIDTETRVVIATLAGSSTPDIALTPDGRFVYAVDQSPETGGVFLISTADDTVTFIPASNISVFESVRFSPDGRYLYVESSDDGQLVSVDLEGVGAAGGDAAAA